MFSSVSLSYLLPAAARNPTTPTRIKSTPTNVHSSQVPLVSITGRGSQPHHTNSDKTYPGEFIYLLVKSLLRACYSLTQRSRFFLPPKNLGNTPGISQILMPTAPTRIKPAPLGINPDICQLLHSASIDSNQLLHLPRQNALHRQKHPPNWTKTPQITGNSPNQEGDNAPGGRNGHVHEANHKTI